MKSILKKKCMILGIILLFCLWHVPAYAAASFTAITIPTIPQPVEVVMNLATTPTITFRVTNTSTGVEAFNQVQFRLANTNYSNFPNLAVTFNPPGTWTCKRNSSTRITCVGNGSTITPGNALDFGIRIMNRNTLTTDRTNQLSRVTVWYNNGANNLQLNYPNANLTVQWTWKTLLMTLTPSVANVSTSCTFTLTMTVTNKTAATNIPNVYPSPTSPTRNYTGGPLTANVLTGPTPASLSPLNFGATQSMVWTYNLTGTVPGTVAFTACATGTSGNCATVTGASRTSSAVTSSVVNYVNGACFSVSTAETPTCLYSGGTTTITMLVTNNTGTNATNVKPGALTPVVTGAAAFGMFSAPSPTFIPNLPTGNVGTFTWTAPVTGNVNDTYAVASYATATVGGLLATTPTVTSPDQDIDGFTYGVGTANANSTNQELTWSITNFACAKINSVAIAVPGGFPAGWTFANDAYSLVNNIPGNEDDSWNPPAGPFGTTFSSPTTTARIPPAPAASPFGNFSLLFSQTPTSAGTYTFNVTITDDSLPTPVVTVLPTYITVLPYDNSSPDAPNGTGNSLWHENIQ